MFSFRPKVIAQFQSDYSGQIQVVQGWGYRHLSTRQIQHSGGIVGEIWAKALKNRAQKQKSWLVLGVAGGTIIHFISQKFSPTRIVGVDIDPVIVDVGRKYFGLDHIPHTQIIIADAQKYLAALHDNFDYLLVDLFGVSGPPPFVYQEIFLKQLKNVASQVLINHLYNTPENIQAGENLVETLSRLDFSPQTRRVLANVVIIY